MYKLYQITNTFNEKSYIGITKLSINERWNVHVSNSRNPKYPLHHAIAKYGSDSFIITLLEKNQNRKVISDLEEFTIQQLKTHITQQGYNVAKGGYGGDLGPEANKKRSETIQNFSLEKRQELTKKQKERQIGKTKYNDAGRLAQSLKVIGNKSRLGIQHTEKSKSKISIANTGKKRSDLSRQNYSKSAIINKNSLRFAGRRASCLCCKKEFDIGNYTLHIKRTNYEF